MILHISLSGCQSLKEKRSVVKPLLAFLQHEYKLSAAEIDLQEKWNSTMIACVMVSNDGHHNQATMSLVKNAIESRFPELEILSSQIEPR